MMASGGTSVALGSNLFVHPMDEPRSLTAGLSPEPVGRFVWESAAEHSQADNLHRWPWDRSMEIPVA